MEFHGLSTGHCSGTPGVHVSLWRPVGPFGLRIFRLTNPVLVLVPAGAAQASMCHLKLWRLAVIYGLRNARRNFPVRVLLPAWTPRRPCVTTNLWRPVVRSVLWIFEWIG